MRKMLYTLILLSSILFAQQESAHKYFFEKFHGNSEEASITHINRRLPEPGKNINLSSSVFGFLPDWEFLSGSANYLHLNLLSHIAVFGFEADSLGNLTPPFGWPWTDFISVAHQSNIKVLITIISFNNGTTHKLLTNEQAKQNLYNNIYSILSTNNLDGVNIDFEGLYESDRGSNITSFLAALNEFLPNEMEVSFDSPFWNWGGWDFNELAASCDYLFIMGYDAYGSWSTTSGPSSPLTGGYVNLQNALTYNSQYGTVVQNNPEKLILGFPYYGNHWTTESNSESSDVIEYISSLTYRTITSGFEWNDKQWSNEYNTPRYVWDETKCNQIWFDDDSSLTLKYEFAKQKNLKGVGIWALGFDGNRTELWDALNSEFGNGAMPRPQPPVEFSVSKVEQTTANISFSQSANADGYKIYISNDGVNFYDSIFTAQTEVTYPITENNNFYFKVCAVNSSGNSLPTHTLGINSAVSSQNVLIVDGFDRYYGNNNEFSFITRYGECLSSLGYNYASCNNESIICGTVLLNDYDFVIYMLGNESRASESVNYFEENAIANFLNSSSLHGLFISGSEIGYDIGDASTADAHDLNFFNNVLHADYISDAPAGLPSHFYSVIPLSSTPVYMNLSFDDGSHGTYNVAYPDAIKPFDDYAVPLSQYAGSPSESGFAAIASSNSVGNKTVYLAFPFETVYPFEVRKDLLSNILIYLDNQTGTDEIGKLPQRFSLSQNFPNPFNPTTTIEYSIPSVVARYSGTPDNNVSLTVYDVLGRKLRTIVNKQQAPGNYSVKFNANYLPSGIYFYKLQSGNFSKTRKMILMK